MEPGVPECACAHAACPCSLRSFWGGVCPGLGQSAAAKGLKVLNESVSKW